MQSLLKNISLRELRMLMTGLGLIAAVAAIVVFVVPGVKSLRTATNAVDVLERAALDGGDLERRIQERHDRIEGLKQQLHGDMAGLPARQIEAFVIGRLQKVSWNNDVELVSLEPAIGKEVESFQELLFNVRLVGQYSNLYRWLVEAREELGYVVVKDYSLARQDDDNDTPLLAASLSLASYRVMR